MFTICRGWDISCSSDAWQPVTLANYFHLVELRHNAHDFGNYFILKDEVESWLSAYVKPKDCMIFMSTNIIELTFKFKDPAIAVLFKLTWQI
jgi:hypothetical protein